MSERDFLHDVSGPMTTALLLIETLCDSLNNGKTAKSGDRELARQVKKTLCDVRDMIDRRRKTLVESK